ncbi:hypothetical protein CBW56_08665 [Denitratisoma oestradiolicum]|nr:hypothetical protein CBW56_08665 [Denitratisoma oestradiolicum]
MRLVASTIPENENAQRQIERPPPLSPSPPQGGAIIVTSPGEGEAGRGWAFLPLAYFMDRSRKLASMSAK